MKSTYHVKDVTDIQKTFFFSHLFKKKKLKTPKVNPYVLGFVVSFVGSFCNYEIYTSLPNKRNL